MSEHQIDPALLELDQPQVEGRGTKRKARTSSTAAAEVVPSRTSTRLAGKSNTAVSSSSIGVGAGGGGGKKGKGGDVGEPARGEEENLNKLRGGVCYLFCTTRRQIADYRNAQGERIHLHPNRQSRNE